MDVLYLDNAATSYPKPETNDRGHDSLPALCGRISQAVQVTVCPLRPDVSFFETREILAKLFNIADPLRLAFTKNATEAINIVS